MEEKPEEEKPDDKYVIENVFDYTLFKENLQNRIKILFDQIPGKKSLVLEECVIGPLTLSISLSKLKELGVQQQLFLDSEDIYPKFKEVIFFITPRTNLIKLIAKIIQNNEKKNSSLNYTLVFWPRRTIMCKEALERAGIFADVKIKDFSFDLIPIEKNVLSMEMNHKFKDIYIENELSVFTHIVESLQRIQLVYGQINTIFGKGSGAKVVLDILDSLDENKNKMDSDYQKHEIDCMFIFDRAIDWVTPLCTQLTYYGLIDEIFGIKNSIITIDSKFVKKQESNEERQDKVQQILSGIYDEVFDEISDTNIGILRNKITVYIEEYKRLVDQKSKDQTIAEMNQYLRDYKVAQRKYTATSLHVNLGEAITKEMKQYSFHRNLQIEHGIILGQDPKITLDFLEIQIGLQMPFNKVMRLLCLQSLVNGGIPQKQFDFLRRELLQCYGFENILLLYKLEKLGLFKKQEDKNWWRNLEKNLKLIYEEVKEQNPDDCSYAYSGYTPLTARLIEQVILKGSWDRIEPQLKTIHGPTIQIGKQYFNPRPSDNKKQVILVYIIGGITYGEIAAIRFLGKQYNKEIVICTTQIINGNNIFNSLKETYDYGKTK